MPRRTIQFVELGDEITLVALVCEDLAQIGDLGEMIRSVGPTAVITPLLDGPQLSSRWAARYASVLADDPGSSVLTLTSYGMVQRSRPHGRDVSPVIALWKDPVRGTREILLEPGAQGVLLTICGDRATRRTADGRRPLDNVAQHFDVAIHQVSTGTAGSAILKLQSERTAPRSVMEIDELTVLTGWAQALTEAIAYAPECVKPLFAEANAGAPWRAELGIIEPSKHLSEAISMVDRIVRTAARGENPPTLDALRGWCRDQPPKQGVEGLVHRVLRSTLEQLLTRQAS